MRSDGRDARIAHALDRLAEQRRGEVWDRLLVQLNALAEKEALRHPERDADADAEDTGEDLDPHLVELLRRDGED